MQARDDERPRFVGAWGLYRKTGRVHVLIDASDDRERLARRVGSDKKLVVSLRQDWPESQAMGRVLSHARSYGSAQGRIKTKVYPLGGYGVDVKLRSRTDPPDVFWSDRGNSYVVADNPRGDHRLYGKPVTLFSVNGIGEIRWNVPGWTIDHALRMEREDKLTPDMDAYEQLAAARHFGLVR